MKEMSGLTLIKSEIRESEANCLLGTVAIAGMCGCKQTNRVSSSIPHFELGFPTKSMQRWNI